MTHDPSLAYGVARVPFTRRKPTAASLAGKTAAEKAMDEKARQFRLYRIAKRAERERWYAEPTYGSSLRKFGATLGHFGIEDADRLLAYVAAEARAWLQTAPDDIRHVAGELLSERIARIRIREGLPVFDDPIFDEEPDVRMLCREAIRL